MWTDGYGPRRSCTPTVTHWTSRSRTTGSSGYAVGRRTGSTVDAWTPRTSTVGRPTTRPTGSRDRSYAVTESWSRPTGTPRWTLWWNAAHSCRSEEHTSELQSRFDLVCRLLL